MEHAANQEREIIMGGQTTKRNSVEVLARAGYSARGIVYLIIGGMAILAATGNGGDTPGTQGALQKILEQPFGKLMLGAVTFGFLGYSVWRIVQGVKDADHHGTSAKGLTIRTGLVISGISHLGLALAAASLTFGWGFGGGGSGGGDDSQGWVTMLMMQPWGQWLVGIVGVFLIGIGIAQIVKAWNATFRRHMEAPQQTWQWATPVCRVGLVSRGLVFLLMGGFVIAAAVKLNPEKAKTLSELLSTLRDQPYGPWLLGAAALGLVAFGIYSCIEARFRRISV